MYIMLIYLFYECFFYNCCEIKCYKRKETRESLPIISVRAMAMISWKLKTV